MVERERKKETEAETETETERDTDTQTHTKRAEHGYDRETNSRDREKDLKVSRKGLFAIDQQLHVVRLALKLRAEVPTRQNDQIGIRFAEFRFGFGQIGKDGLEVVSVH